MRFRTLQDVDFAGHDLRIWCHRCARGTVVDGSAWESFLQRGWSIALDQARQHFRCTSCGRHDAILIVPARRVEPGPVDWAGQVVRYFHACRARRKLEKRNARHGG